MRAFILFLAIAAVALAGFVGGGVDTSIPGWFSISQAEAGPHRRSVRRTSRRTARRTSNRRNYYGGAAVAGAAVVTAVAVGSMVSNLPPSCSTVIIDGIRYHNCSGTYYAPSGSRWVVVEAP